MDSAHCANDPLRLKPNQNDGEIQNMKEDHERKIQVLTFEHKIRVLELEKALSEKENIIQSMKHEREIENLKMARKEIETQALNKEENENKMKLRELEEKIESLKNELTTSLALKVDKEIRKDSEKITLLDEMVWGIDNFFHGEYEAWYRKVSMEMENKRVYEVKNHLLVKKNFGKCFEKLFFVSKREGFKFNENANDFLIEGFNPEELWRLGEFKVLHPKSPMKCLTRSDEAPTVAKDYNFWKIIEITKEYFYGDKKSAILLVRCKRERVD